MDGVDLVPFAPDGAATRVKVWLERNGATLRARWLVDVPLDRLILPNSGEPARKDDLWRTTCFEVFLAVAGASYLEVNAAPSGDWAAYRFAGPREGMTPSALAQPAIRMDAGEDWISLEATLVLPPDLASVPLTANIAAVIETTDGALSHWALAHPADRPDFHDRSCLRLSLPATG